MVDERGKKKNSLFFFSENFLFFKNFFLLGNALFICIRDWVLNFFPFFLSGFFSKSSSF